MLRLQFDCAIENMIDEKIINKLKSWKDIIVFGAGESGEWVVNLLRHYGMNPRCYCDNYSGKWGQEKSGLLIMSFEDAISQYSGAAICIASMWSEEILKQIGNYDDSLSERTWDLLTSMAWETSNLSYSSSECAFIQDNLEKFEVLYDSLADNKSRDTLEGILNYRLTRNKEYLAKVKSSEETYFDKTLINFSPQDKEIIDAGAFDGDTIETIIKQWGGHRLKIHCYETEEKNCVKIENKIHGLEWSGHIVSLHKAALWNKSGEKLCFSGSGLSGSLNGNGKNLNGSAVITECIDDFSYKNVGFIKMDIEGAERAALEGGRKTINRDLPILAICVYHLQDDLLVLPNMIRSINESYLLYLRHYMNSAGDTILYAIPKS